jgi:hypothetical protein
LHSWLALCWRILDSRNKKRSSNWTSRLRTGKRCHTNCADAGKRYTMSTGRGQRNLYGPKNSRTRRRCLMKGVKSAVRNANGLDTRSASRQVTLAAGTQSSCRSQPRRLVRVVCGMTKCGFASIHAKPAVRQSISSNWWCLGQISHLSSRSASPDPILFGARESAAKR